MAKIYLRVTIPDELQGEFMQVIRDFDTKHDPHHRGIVHTDMLTETDFPAEKMADIMQQVAPRMRYMGVKRFDEGE